MDTKEVKKICDFLASLPIGAVTSAYLIDPLSNATIQQGFAAHHICDKVVTDQDILNYRAGIKQIPDFAIEYAKLHMK